MVEEPTFELDANEGEHYTQVPNALIRDRSISPHARWLASFLMSHARGFRVTLGTIMHSADCGKDRAYKSVDELIRAGYVTRLEERSDSGRFVRYRYIIRKRPLPDLPDAAQPVAVNPQHKKTSNHRTPDGVQVVPSPPAVTTEGREITDGMRRLCVLLADHVEGMTGNRPTIGQRWLDASRLLLTRDGLSEAQVEYLIRYVAGGWWASRILSMPKLREKRGTLIAQIRQDSRPHRPKTSKTGLPVWEYDDPRWADLASALPDMEGAPNGSARVDSDGPAGARVLAVPALPAPNGGVVVAER